MLLSSINMMSGSYNVHTRKPGVCEGNNGVNSSGDCFQFVIEPYKKTMLFCGGVGGKEQVLQTAELQHERFHGGEE